MATMAMPLPNDTTTNGQGMLRGRPKCDIMTFSELQFGHHQYPLMRSTSRQVYSAVEVCGSSLQSYFRTLREARDLKLCGACERRTADPKNGGPRYAEPVNQNLHSKLTLIPNP